jgi:hypothetical protein
MRGIEFGKFASSLNIAGINGISLNIDQIRVSAIQKEMEL